MFAANNVPDVMKEEPSVNHVSHHLQKIATFALSWTTVFEDDVPPGSEDSSNAKLAFEDDSSMFEREAAEDVSYQNHNPTSFPQNQTQKYHAILGPYDQLHSNQPHNEPIETSILKCCRVLYKIPPENKPPTPSIDLEAKPQAQTRDG